MHDRVTLRPVTEADSSFAYHVLETTMRGHAEAIWGDWNEAAAKVAMIEKLGASRSSIIEVVEQTPERYLMEYAP